MVNPITPSDLVRSVHLAASSNGVCIIGHNNTVYIILVSTGFSIALPLSYVVRAVAVNPSGTAVAFGGDGKFVEIADLEHSNGALRIVKRHQTESVTKRIINVSFETDESLLVGDKFGEIFRCSAANGYALAQSSRSILAHLGMITALTTSVAVDSLVTADRDGNVRVSSHKLPDEIRGFLWIPLADARRLNSKDAVTCSLAWVTPHVLATGTLDGIVSQWDLSRASIDQSDALVEAPVKYDSPIVGFVKRGSVTRAAVDGDLFLRGLGEAKDTKTLAVPSPVVAAADRVMLHRDGTLSQLTDDDRVVAISGFRVDSADLGTLDVKALWHTREAKTLGGAQDDADGEGEVDAEDELEPSAKRAPRAEEPTAAL